MEESIVPVDIRAYPFPVVVRPHRIVCGECLGTHATVAAVWNCHVLSWDATYALHVARHGRGLVAVRDAA